MSEAENMTAETTTHEVPEELRNRIEATINKIRPYIQQDGGDVQFVDFEDGVVTVRMLGACAGCMSIDSTLSDGIQAILIDEVPEVTEVRLDQGGFDSYGSNSGSGFSWY